MSWRWSYLDTLLDPYYLRSRSWNYNMYDKYYGDLLGSKSDYFSTYYTDLAKSYPSSTYYPSTYYPSSYYYPYLSDSELRYPYRIRSPLYSSGYPTYRVAPRSWLPNWYPSYSSPRALRDPWWYDLPIYRGPTKSTYPLIRQSYLSPVKRTYVWSQHPIRRGVRW